MRIDRGLLGWGVFLIALGVVPLAAGQGLLDREVAARAWQLWPLILVGAGLGLLLRRTPLEGAGGLVVAGTVGAMLGGVLAAGASFSFPFRDGGCGLGDGAEGVAFPSQGGTLAANAEVDLELSCGELTVSVGPGAAWSVAGTDDDGRGPDITADGGTLAVASRDTGPFESGRESWAVTVPTDASLDLTVTVNAGSGRLDLAGGHLGALTLDVNAGDVVADLSEASGPSQLEVSINAASLSLTLPRTSIQGSIGANAGSVELCVPSDVALRIVTDENLTASYDFGRAGLVQEGETWTSPGFAAASTQIELEVEANAGSVVLDPVDGCL